MSQGVDGYFGDPRVLRDQSGIIRRVGDDVGLQSQPVRRAGDSAAAAVGDPALSQAVRSATTHVAAAVDQTSGTLWRLYRLGHVQAGSLMQAFGEEDA